MQVQFIEEAICQKQGSLLSSGAFAVRTGKHTGRAAKSRFIVQDDQTQDTVDWGEVNKPFPSEDAKRILREVQTRLAESRVFQVRGFVGPFPIEVLTASAWHAAFAENMFRDTFIEDLADTASKFPGAFGTIRIYHDPYTRASAYGVNTAEDAVIVLDPKNFSVTIAGTAYAGEIKKSAFSLANYLLPASGVLSMHASANCREDGSESCVLFGLSGTGKTTLSAQANRYLIGDDEIVWSDTGLSNLEGGCYAKLIDLTEEKEPDIYRAVNQFGSILENVSFDEETRQVDFSDASLTENTRGSYKLEALSRVYEQKREAVHPKTIIFLTADAFGALPAVARLDEWQMQYHFMSGFTAKVAGTEMGLKEPKAAFSACFGAPFMPRSPSVYAHLLAEKAKKFGARVWLLNTGWIGGYQNGERFPLRVTRKLVEMIQSGELDRAELVRHPVFGFEVPVAANGIDSKYLKIPEGPQVSELARLFFNNQQKFTDSDSREICLRGGPVMNNDQERETKAPIESKAEKGQSAFASAQGAKAGQKEKAADTV